MPASAQSIHYSLAVPMAVAVDPTTSFSYLQFLPQTLLAVLVRDGSAFHDDSVALKYCALRSRIEKREEAKGHGLDYQPSSSAAGGAGAEFHPCASGGGPLGSRIGAECWRAMRSGCIKAPRAGVAGAGLEGKLPLSTARAGVAAAPQPSASASAEAIGVSPHPSSSPALVLVLPQPPSPPELPP